MINFGGREEGGQRTVATTIKLLSQRIPEVCMRENEIERERELGSRG